MKHAILGLFAAVMLISPAFAAKMVCKDTGKDVTSSCCCSVKEGKFVCSFTNKTHDKCCCESK